MAEYNRSSLGSVAIGVYGRWFLDKPAGDPMCVPLLGRVIGAPLLYVTSCVTSGPQMLYIAVRGDALPRWLYAVSRRTRVPVCDVWTAAISAFVLGTPICRGSTEFYAVTSFTAASLFIMYVPPTFPRLIHHRAFRPAAWRPRHPHLIGWIGSGYVGITTVITLLPQTYPFVTLKTFTWPVVALVAVLLLVAGYYALRGRNQYQAAERFSIDEIEQLEASVV